MKRHELHRAVELVLPATSVRPTLPLFGCVFFDGTEAAAFDDTMAIHAPCDLPFEGGVPAKQLHDWLRSARSPEVKFEGDESEVKLKAGRAKVTLPSLPLGDFVFEKPKRGGVVLTGGALPIHTILQEALVSIADDTDYGDFYGLMLHFDEDLIVGYSTNNIVATRTLQAFEVPKKLHGRTLQIPAQTVKAVVRLMGETEVMSDDWRIVIGTKFFQVEIDGVTITSKVGQSKNVTNYEGMFSSVEWAGSWLPAKRDLVDALKAAQVAKDEKGLGVTRLTAEGNDILLATKTDSGLLVEDAVDLGEPHPKMDVLIQPDLAHSAMDPATEFRVYADSFLAATNGDTLRLVALVSEGS